MKTLVHTIVLLALLAPAPTLAANKPGSSSFTAMQQRRGGVFAFLKRKLVPFWKLRFKVRQQNQWNKPGGVNFPTRSKPKRYFSPVKEEIIQPKKRVGFWRRLRIAWRARWGNRHVARQASTLENQAGFGHHIKRPDRIVSYSWRNRFDNKRLKPKPMRQTERRAKRQTKQQTRRQMMQRMKMERLEQLRRMRHRQSQPPPSGW